MPGHPYHINTEIRYLSRLVTGSVLLVSQEHSTSQPFCLVRTAFWVPRLKIHTAVVLIKLFKPKPIQLPVEASEPLQPENTGSVRSGDETAPPPHQLQSLSFDLSLARFALIIDIISYILLPLAPNALMFTVYTMMGCLGTGFSPAIQSVAMGLYTQQGGTELGKLFGALSVMSALW